MTGTAPSDPRVRQPSNSPDATDGSVNNIETLLESFSGRLTTAMNDMLESFNATVLKRLDAVEQIVGKLSDDVQGKVDASNAAVLRRLELVEMSVVHLHQLAKANQATFPPTPAAPKRMGRPPKDATAKATAKATSTAPKRRAKSAPSTETQEQVVPLANVTEVAKSTVGVAPTLTQSFGISAQKSPLRLATAAPARSPANSFLKAPVASKPTVAKRSLMDSTPSDGGPRKKVSNVTAVLVVPPPQKKQNDAAHPTAPLSAGPLPQVAQPQLPPRFGSATLSLSSPASQSLPKPSVASTSQQSTATTSTPAKSEKPLVATSPLKESVEIAQPPTTNDALSTSKSVVATDDAKPDTSGLAADQLVVVGSPPTTTTAESVTANEGVPETSVLAADQPVADAAPAASSTPNWQHTLQESFSHLEQVDGDAANNAGNPPAAAAPEAPQAPVKRKPGRPRKVPLTAHLLPPKKTAGRKPPPSEPLTKRPRGRPRKVPLPPPEIVILSDDDDDEDDDNTNGAVNPNELFLDGSIQI